MNSYFTFNDRLRIDLPDLPRPWESFTRREQEKILGKWEEIRGEIPDRISEIEEKIKEKQQDLYNEENFEMSCLLNSEISELASQINDLWIWFRTSEVVRPHAG
ncbi:hypothetical protein RZN22_05115 [Bacillaceae bacterium S4-13-58]